MILAALFLALSFSAPPLPRPELDFPTAASVFRSAHGLNGLEPEEVDLSALLERDFISTQVGLFEVWIPRADLAEKESAQDYRDVCAALCAAQDRWIDWLAEKAIDGKAWRKSLADQRKWVEKWSISRLTTAGGEGPANALDFFEAKQDVREQSAALAQAMQSGAVLGKARENARPARLVLMPRRKDFIEFLAFVGWCRPNWQSSYWVDGAEGWNEFRVDDLQMIALQYPAGGAQPGDYAQASSMKDISNQGLEEQVVQLGMNRLLAQEHDGMIPGPLVKALSINMIIELYGVCHTRLDGDTHGANTNAREAFVRGGKSEGGEFAMNVAGNRWRAEFGKYHYARILKQAQKSGASSDKRNKHKYNSFLLVGDNEGDRFIAHAPLFDPTVTPESPPEKVRGDYQEFDRAYRAAFMYWLQTAAAGSKKDSKAAFAALLARLASQASGDAASTAPTFAEIVQEIYEAPLSDPEVGLGSLEGRFLKWISQQ